MSEFDLPEAKVTVISPDGTEREVIGTWQRGEIADPNFAGWDEITNADGSKTCVPRSKAVDDD